jgi:hypothetical protein
MAIKFFEETEETRAKAELGDYLAHEENESQRSTRSSRIREFQSTQRIPVRERRSRNARRGENGWASVDERAQPENSVGSKRKNGNRSNESI